PKPLSYADHAGARLNLPARRATAFAGRGWLVVECQPPEAARRRRARGRAAMRSERNLRRRMAAESFGGLSNNDMHRSRRSAVLMHTGNAARRPADVER